MMKRIILFIIPVLALLISCDDKKDDKVKFSYPGIIDKEYRFNVGRVIPVTIGQSIETDGDISRDGRFFFYSSNSAGGNFDIYLRSMTDITTVRLTSHPSKDTMPVISPDGKHLAFVSFREDPEGDIFVMKIKPESLIKKEEESVTSISTLDSIAENISVERDPESGIILNIKDSYPAWSPDGKLIAYSSSKGGASNIWLMKPDGSDKKKLTGKGGDYPAFSIDGKSVAYISYRENPHGDVYVADIASGKETRITSDGAIKLYPSFIGSNDRIIYSSIEADTNRNGSLDLQDRSLIRFIDIKSGLTYPMTKRSESSFKARWLPVLSTRDYSGIIVYTDITGENINLNIIPETGIIPKKNNAKLQYDMCDDFLVEYDDSEKYILALQAVYNIYWKNSDNASRAYVDRSLGESILYYRKSGETAELKKAVSLLKKRAEEKDSYASFIMELIESHSGSKWKGENSSIVNRFSSDKNSQYFIPFALEDVADLYIARGDNEGAAKTLRFISEKYPTFERNMDVQVKISLCTDDLRSRDLSDSAALIIAKGNTNQKITVTNNLVAPFSGASFKDPQTELYLSKISKIKTKYGNDKKIAAMSDYISGLLYFMKGANEKAKESLLSAITESHPNDITYYLSNIKLGDMEMKAGHNIEAEKYYGAGINRYSRRFKTENFREKLVWLVGYYNQTGEKFIQGGNFKDSAEIFEKLINILTLMYNKKLYREIYMEHAPGAHVLYIDSYVSWKGGDAIADLEKVYYDKLDVYRMDFNKAAIYGFGYLYTKKAMHIASTGGGSSQDEVFKALKDSDEQINWALFIDDTFIEPYILKSWIYQYIDLERETGGDGAVKYSGRYFPRHLWEENTMILEKALNVNNENLKPEYEGDLHLNMANSYFLLTNYPRALKSYRLAEKYKKRFGSEIEKALFHFHLGYTLWQSNDIKGADAEIKKAYDIYKSLSLGEGGEKYSQQTLILWRYFALFARYENRFSEAIDWYIKILKFAEENRIAIDRARYYQDIAWCYIKKEDYDSARSWLARSSDELEKYSEDERVYKAKIKIFGVLGPIPVWNLGEDQAVVGDSKIFYPLDKRQKKLLNLAMYEEIAVSEGNYAEAVKFLTKKLSILEDSDTAVSADTKIRSLNNIGYYAYLSGRLSEAENYFNKAEALAKEKMNLEGTNRSMMNLVNLYSMMIEGGSGKTVEWNKKLTELIKRIEAYRKNYFDFRYAQEKDKIDAEAKAKKTEVTADQISEMTERVKSETLSLYYSLDVSAAILKFYLAELTYASDPVQSTRDSSKQVYYTANRDAFNLYSGALKNFETSIAEAGKSGNGELKAKLLINSGICYERTGDYEKAYVTLLDAKNFSEKNSLGWIRINANHRLAMFLASHGREVGESDSYSMAEKFYNAAVVSIEENSFIYSRYQNRVGTIYRDYINFLIATGNERRAFQYAERYSQVAAVMAVNTLSPEFSNEYDREFYYGYVTGAMRLESLRSDLSALLIAGKDQASAEVTSLKSTIKTKETQLAARLKEINKSSSSVKRYIETVAYNERPVKYDIYRFHETEKGLYHWKVSGGKITSGYISGGSDSIIAPGPDPVFILLNETSVDLINSGKLKSSVRYIFINSMSRISEYLNDSNAVTGGYYSDSKLAGQIEGVQSFVGGEFDPARYAVIVDFFGTGFEAVPEALFASKISPSCIIQSGAECSYSYLVSMLEGALYAGTRRLVIVPGKDEASVVSILKMIYGKQQPVPGTPFFTLGYINTFNEKNNTDDKRLQDNEHAQYKKFMQTADFTKAGIHLAKWNSVRKDRQTLEYTDMLWQIALLGGKGKGAISVLDSYIPSGENDKTAIKLRKVYTYIYTGDFFSARRELATINKTAAFAEDTGALNGLISLVSDGRVSAIEEIKKITKQVQGGIPAERYLIIAAEYLYAINDRSATGIATLITEEAILSESEHMVRNLITGRAVPDGRSIRLGKIASLGNGDDLAMQRGEALKLVNGPGGVDSLSAFPVIKILSSQRDKDSDTELMQFLKMTDIQKISDKSDYLVSLMLVEAVDGLIAQNENAAEREAVLSSLLTMADKYSLSFIKKETILNSALNYMMMEKFDQSFRVALGGEDIFVPDDISYIDIQLLRMNLYIRSGKFKEAAVKGDLLSKIENLSADRKFILTLQLALIELQRLSSLKQATISDAAQFEKLFTSALSMAKNNTGLLKRRGFREITSTVFDEFIIYKMKTGQHSDAHYYNEVKKLLIASSKGNVNLFKYAGTVDMGAFQGTLPEDSVYLSIARGKGGLIVWAADRKMKRAFIIEKGYDSLKPFIGNDSSGKISDKSSVKSIKSIAAVLSPLSAIVKGKKLLLISTDSETESIPFELTLGESLSSGGRILFIPSLLVSTYTGGSISKEVFLPEADDSALSYIVKVAVRESGIKQTRSPAKGGFVHFLSKIRYNRGKMEFTSSGKGVKTRVDGSSAILASSDEIDGAGVTDFLLSARDSNLMAAVINGSQVQDTNNALFIEEFYRSFADGNPLSVSFFKALDTLRSNGRFIDRSYWSGYRLYVYDLNMIK